MDRPLHRSMLLAVGCALALASCRVFAQGDEPAQEPFRGTLTSGCAPNDAISKVLVLRSPTDSRQVIFTLWPSSSVSIPGEFRFAAGGGGSAVVCLGPEACQPATWGTLRFVDSSAEGRIGGDWELGMPDGHELSGAFEADWPAIEAVCP